MNALTGWEDTIVALATAPGVSAIGVIRLSGNQSWQIVDMLMPKTKLLTKESHTIHFGLLKHEGEPIDEVLVSLFKGPKSYTGEDVVEISSHGSPYIQEQIIKACLFRGARLARAGEFTQRAFLNGKMDLAQAESVADMIEANTAASHRTALHNMRGGFSVELSNLREQLVRFAALIELELDFAMEDVEFANRETFYESLKESAILTKKLLDSFVLGNVIRNGVSVAIIGKPNAGKSTLLNTLLNEERAIVSDIAGTTRDTIEETINIHGILFRLIDTAGIREGVVDSIEHIGIEKSLEKMKQANLVVYLFDVNTEGDEELQEKEAYFKKEGVRFLFVANKVDSEDQENKLESGRQNIVKLSAKHKRGIEDLKMSIYNHAINGKINPDQTIVTNLRHHQALEKIIQSIDAIHQGLDDKIPGDLLAIEIRTCLFHLGEITGEISNEDKLDFIFSKFCIGK